MVPENPESNWRECGTYLSQLPQTRAMVAFHPVPKISGQNGRIMRGGLNEFCDNGRQSVIQIAVKIAELEQAKARKFPRQARKAPSLMNDLNIQKTASHFFAQPENPEQAIDNRIKWNHAFQTEHAFALVNEPRGFCGLPCQTPVECGVSHSIPQNR
jgi:hypothetical protein